MVPHAPLRLLSFAPSRRKVRLWQPAKKGPVSVSLRDNVLVYTQYTIDATEYGVILHTGQAETASHGDFHPTTYGAQERRPVRQLAVQRRPYKRMSSRRRTNLHVTSPQPLSQFLTSCKLTAISAKWGKSECDLCLWPCKGHPTVILSFVLKSAGWLCFCFCSPVFLSIIVLLDSCFRPCLSAYCSLAGLPSCLVLQLGFCLKAACC